MILPDIVEGLPHHEPCKSEGVFIPIEKGLEVGVGLGQVGDNLKEGADPGRGKGSSGKSCVW